MEAKVDIRKLQLLNDRITQTIDALNQVRLTVHGLGHSSPYQGNPFLTGSFGTQQFSQPFAQQPWGQYGGVQGIGQYGMGVNPFQTGSMGGFGLQHSSPYTQGSLLSQIQNPLLSQIQNPLASQILGGAGGVGGLQHTSPEFLIDNQVMLARSSDPSRISVTFPFAFQPQSPLVGLGI